jgi:uncharacterized repeat protein (TIGR01451 family)
MPSQAKIFLAILFGWFFTAFAPAWAQVCAVPGKDGVTFARNSYFPGVGTASAGATTVNIGAARVDANAATTAFAVGDLALIIQMQDSSINNNNTNAYGDGVAGDPATGSTALRSSGRYEFKRVVAVGGGNITVDSGLSNTYTDANATATDGNRRWQVIRVPQFASLTLPGGTLGVTAWNGATGGVFILDVSGTLNLNNTTINADAVGFRGGGSQEATVISGVGAVDYATAQVAGAPPANRGAAKGEGIAGTPRFVRGTTITNGYTGQNLGVSGYPNSLDLSRGAPGNAGGGGTQHNAGGGGGANAGTGGRGGDSYAQYSATNTGGCVFYAANFWGCGGDGSRAVGGFGGLGLTPDPLRLYLGGGGGAGESNNAGDNPAIAQGSGGNGGGIIFIRGRTITGTGVLNARGQTGENGGRDAAGGGGGGGTVIVITESVSVPGLQANTAGGNGGNTGLPLTGGETQGTGGGGGGGAVILPTTLAIGTQTVAGGSSGQNNPAAGAFSALGAAAGAGGVANVDFGGNPFPNPASCFPVLNVVKTTTTPARIVPTNNTAQYVITLTNTGLGGAAGVAITDSLPSPFLVSATTAAAASTSVAGPNPAPVSGTATANIGNPGGTVANSFVVLPGAVLTLTWTVSIDGAVAGTYQNSASATYSDPTRTVNGTVISPGGTYTGGGSVPGSNYTATSSTGEDVIISGSGATVSSAISACVSPTTEITTTNLLSNSDFLNTGAALGQYGGVGLATLNTEPVKNNVAYQTGLANYPDGDGGGADQNMLQYPFPGDVARSIPASNNWVFAHGNDGLPGSNFGAWSQSVTGLIPGRTYTFIVYVSNPTQPGATHTNDASLVLDVTQTGLVTNTLGVVPDDTVGTGDVWTLRQTTFLATQTTATLGIRNTIETTASQSQGRLAIAQPTLRLCAPMANLQVSKTNGTTTLAAGATTTYTVTFSNFGPGDASGAIVQDTPSTGLSNCSVLSCNPAGGAACPGTPANLLAPSTTTLPTFPSSSSVTFSVRCGVSSTGL